MNRRSFIRNGLIGGAAAVTGTVACGSCPPAGPAPPPPPRRPSFDLTECTIADLQEEMDHERLSSRAVTQMYLERIEELDRQGPCLQSVIETNPEALAIADALDEERRAKGPRSPLHGIPVLLKDNIDTADQMTTTAGSLALKGSIPRSDAFVAKKLRQAGAVLLGKANLSEWANFRSLRSSSGWSARGGQCRNPFALDRNPCGSSSGSAAAVSANLAAVSIGTETDGSIVCPSHANGVVGIKPTLGLVSRSGIIPIAHSQDTAGPIARTVTDAAILLTAIAGVDPKDRATDAAKERIQPDYTQFLDAGGLEGARIGVARKCAGFHEKVDALLEAALQKMRSLGAVIVDPADLPTHGQFDESELEVLLYEFKADLNAYLSGLGPGAPVRSLEALIEYNEQHRDVEMPFFEQELFVKAQAKGPLTSKEYLDALDKNHRLSREEGIDAVMNQHELDAIVAPTGGPAWVTDLVNGDHFSGSSSTAAAVAGYPNITVPGGFVHGLPVGLSFFGRAWSEPVLIKLAYAFEQATRFRHAPGFLPTLDQ